MDFINILKEFNEKRQLDLNLFKVQFFINEEKLKVFLFSNLKEASKSLDDFVDVFASKLGLRDSSIEVYLYDLDKFLDFLLEELSRDFSIFSNISIDDFKIEDKKISLAIANEFILKQVLKHEKYLMYSKFLTNNDYSLDLYYQKHEDIENQSLEYENRAKKDILDKMKKATSVKEKKKEKLEDSQVFSFGFKRKDFPDLVKIGDLVEDHNMVTIEGKVFEYSQFETKKKDFVISFDLDDGEYAVRCKKFIRKDDMEKFSASFKNGLEVKIIGVYKYDDFEKDNTFDVSYIQETKLEKKEDRETTKRIEFNIHSKYSNLEGLVDFSDLMPTLKNWGHKAFAITDTYNVQAYPEVYKAAKKAGIKLNLGCEFKILDDNLPIITNYYKKQDLNNKDIVVFDIETTGLSRYIDNITEIGAVKIRDGKIIDVYQQLVNPEMIIPKLITELTGITNEMVAKEPKIEEVLPDFLDFCQDSILAAHNAEFDIGFIKRKSFELGLEFKPVYLDTLWLARALNPKLKNHKLNTLTKKYQVKLLNHHRASDDATATGEILLKMLDQAREKGYDINSLNHMESKYPLSKSNYYMNLVYVKNKTGLKNMYKNISMSSIEYLDKTPGLPEHVYKDNQEGLLIASGGHKTKLFDLIAMGYEDEILYEEAKKFDFFAIEPPSFSDYLIDKHKVKNLRHLEEIILKIIRIALDLEKLVIAVGNVYYMDASDYKYKNILSNYPRKRTVEQKGDFYLRNTSEMLEEFSFLDKNVSEDIVIYNTIELDKQIEDISPIAEGTFPPVIENAEEILKNSCFDKAKSIYGDPLPDLIDKRLNRELNSIISNGYATLYVIAKQLVKKSNEDGYLVGSRGSVGSSFAATMSDITEVNPLEPHYVCPTCKHSEFITDQSYGTGVDLPEKNCPVCGNKYRRDGFDIPFEVFLGFEGDKEPDIDLNFAGVYQSSIHKYTETMFGQRKVFRAGTLGTIADKTAYGMARKFKEFYPDDTVLKLDSANMDKIKRKLVGVKRTTGQHAGGLIIVPEDKDIEDFTPIQYPADQEDSGVITTHFDYHAIDTNLLKLDLLGHNAPSIIRMLSDDTGLDALEIDLSDPASMSIFNGTEALNIRHDYSNSDTGSLGIPEFGTGFVRQMLKDTKPTTFEELVRISGLSHGTDVWLNNAQDLINSGVTVLKNAICTRDDIMNYLIGQGLDKKLSFTIMEKVRKGKGLTQDDEKAMKEINIPQWYIDSCNKIKYMFPRAHAVAYVMMSYRIAYYKVHYPAYFYATYFTNKIADFQYSIISKDLDFLTMYLKEYKSSENPSIDDKYYCIEVAEEMKARGIKLLKPDLYRSAPEAFKVLDDSSILPPLMAIDNVSQQIALRIDEARKDGDFISIEDFTTRTKINKTALASMEAFGLFEGMQNENQLDFFSL
ncbi:MAG: PolC-type DNA polymerase III [Tissierellia bacterium]|nr:PolC-type DNA polymerase III [Tissierellia bacterium]